MGREGVFLDGSWGTNEEGDLDNGGYADVPHGAGLVKWVWVVSHSTFSYPLPLPLAPFSVFSSLILFYSIFLGNL